MASKLARTAADLAEALGCDRTTVDRYIRQGMPRRPDGRFDLDRCRKWGLEHPTLWKQFRIREAGRSMAAAYESDAQRQAAEFRRFIAPAPSPANGEADTPGVREILLGFEADKGRPDANRDEIEARRKQWESKNLAISLDPADRAHNVFNNADCCVGVPGVALPRLRPAAFVPQSRPRRYPLAAFRSLEKGVTEEAAIERFDEWSRQSEFGTPLHAILKPGEVVRWRSFEGYQELDLHRRVPRSAVRAGEAPASFEEREQIDAHEAEVNKRLRALPGIDVDAGWLIETSVGAAEWAGLNALLDALPIAARGPASRIFERVAFRVASMPVAKSLSAAVGGARDLSRLLLGDEEGRVVADERKVLKEWGPDHTRQQLYDMVADLQMAVLSLVVHLGGWRDCFADLRPLAKKLSSRARCVKGGLSARENLRRVRQRFAASDWATLASVTRLAVLFFAPKQIVMSREELVAILTAKVDGVDLWPGRNCLARREDLDQAVGQVLKEYLATAMSNEIIAAGGLSPEHRASIESIVAACLRSVEAAGMAAVDDVSTVAA